MAARRVIIAREAFNDLDDIWKYLETNATAQVANRVLTEILDAANRLSEMPGMGHTHSDLPGRYRVWRVFRYLIVYRFNDRAVHISRVIHGNRNVRRAFRD
jgi:plasmid stabilization system protein ParE